MIYEKQRAWAEISLSNLAHNYKEIRSKLPQGCKFAALCKADAYGHGMKPVAKKLEELGADYLAVSCFDEGRELRESGIKAPILLLAPTQADFAEQLAQLHLTQSVGSLELGRALSERLAESGEPLHIHVKLETGMGRTGFNVMLRSSLTELRKLAELPGLVIDGVFTHFSVSDEPGQEKFTRAQLERFRAAVDILEDMLGKSLGIKHCANSGAVVNYPETALDMVRPGILLYGGYGEAPGFDLRPVMSFRSRIAAITEHRRGDTISYGRTYTCERDMRVAVVTAGYADGVFRSLSNKMEVSVRGRRARQIGRVCMDMFMADVTDIDDAQVGDEVIIFGDEPTVCEQAKKADTISYELLCALSPRVPRVYAD